jgi:hypothetical protein
MIHQENVLRLLLNSASNSLAVLGTEDERAEDQEVKRAL